MKIEINAIVLKGNPNAGQLMNMGVDFNKRYMSIQL